MTIKACLFDIGGVVVRSPMIGIAEYEQELGIPAGYINYTIAATKKGAWQKLERNEIPLNHIFYDEFTSDLRNPTMWKAFHAAKKLGTPATPNPPAIHGETLFWRMMAKSREFDPLMVNAIEKLRKSGKFRLGALTNDYKHPENHPHADTSALRAMFDVFVSSTESGMRKPEEGFYRLAMEKLGVKEPSEIVFLDDIGTNLKAAKALGFNVIRVEIGKSHEAIEQLEKYVGMSLLDKVTVSKL
ncbi:HAD-like protein [Ascodesmis nigricans]|uniref:HAD-like protein n=1 Tax=Ascodesmis nigricans TaxID=341454 RepID=A0A4S2N8G5_9PEZI|nr:HAD-like protein [Ascodesmis nigricans]